MTPAKFSKLLKQMKHLTDKQFQELQKRLSQDIVEGKKTLAERFAEIDIQQVRKEEKENERRWWKYPKRMCKLFKIPHLPQKMLKIA